ncbi:hypothetical protein V9K67_18385 [Paraflavisolibacter sp. H34]|uniref:hypothetical protein n=1 Tax=Huijunlia imazamoxiresistens TaxID=3127457 RepID=UPI003015EAD6
MKRTFTRFVFLILFALSVPGCSREDLLDGHYPVEVAQSVMIRAELIHQGEDENLEVTIGQQSYIAPKGRPQKGSYSFTLLKPDGSSRIGKAEYSLQDGPWQPLKHTIMKGCKNPAILDEQFQVQTKYGTLQAYLKDGLIGEILAGDQSKKNDGPCGNADLGRASIPVPESIDCSSGCLILLKVRVLVDGNEGYNVFPFVIEVY